MDKFSNAKTVCAITATLKAVMDRPKIVEAGRTRRLEQVVKLKPTNLISHLWKSTEASLMMSRLWDVITKADAKQRIVA